MQKLNINIENIFNLTKSVIYNPDFFRPVSHIVIDSRSVRKNSLFIAIKGDRFDGHDFINEALANGASAILVYEKLLSKLDKVNVPIITVPDTIRALGEIANVWRKKLGAKIVSITGSNGKTGTKDILADLLSAKYKVVKTLVNNNNHIGVPLTILSAKKGTEIIVLEHGTNHFGEIEYTANIAEPDFALITNIGESHLEYLVDKQGVYNEKSKLIEACINNHGTIVCNMDDPIIRKETIKVSKRITYGFSGNPEFKAKIKSYDNYGRSNIEITTGISKSNFTLPVYGESNAQNFVAAFAIARRLGLSKSAISNAVKLLISPKGRLQVTELNSNILIDDTYNSNPVSVKAAVKLVKTIKVYKKSLLILGDMFELGPNSKEMHMNLAEEIKSVKNSKVLLIGKLMRSLAAKLEEASYDVKHFKSRNQLNSYLLKNDYSGMKILVKGSRGMQMEQFVETIKSKVL